MRRYKNASSNRRFKLDQRIGTNVYDADYHVCDRRVPETENGRFAALLPDDRRWLCRRQHDYQLFHCPRGACRADDGAALGTSHGHHGRGLAGQSSRHLVLPHGGGHRVPGTGGERDHAGGEGNQLRDGGFLVLQPFYFHRGSGVVRQQQHPGGHGGRCSGRGDHF